MELGDHSRSAIRDPGFPYFCCFSDVVRRSPCCPLTPADPYSGAWNPASGIKPVAAARHEPRLQHGTDLRATSCDCRRQIIPLRPGSCVRSIFVSTSTHSPEGTVVNPQFRLTRSDVEAQTRREVR